MKVSAEEFAMVRELVNIRFFHAGRYSQATHSAQASKALFVHWREHQAGSRINKYMILMMIYYSVGIFWKSGNSLKTPLGLSQRIGRQTHRPKMAATISKTSGNIKKL